MTTFLTLSRLASMTRALAPLAVAASLALLAAGCGSSDNNAGTTSSSGASGEKLAVVASFYPLQYAVEKVGGDHVSVTNLTKPGAEPHDLELTPQDVAKVTSAKLAVYEKGLQPAVDKAIAEQGAKGAFDVSKDADLSLKAPEEDEHDHGKDPKASATPAPAASSEAHDHDHGGQDPHFWLDPVRYAKVAKALSAKMGEVDPQHKADYDKNAEAFAKELDALDKEFSAGLKTCTHRDLVTSHAAFGYLAQRYNLEQEAIAGISPDQEPDPKRLGEIAAHVKEHKVGTIYTETLVSPAIAQTVAKETGTQLAVLDPIEGLNDKSAGKNYLEVMRANLATLKKGQSCG